MKNPYVFVTLLLSFAAISGCGKPDRVDRIDSPNPDLFLTIETSYAAGPAAADFTRIYAQLQAKGQTDKELVLDGQYLQNTKAVWLNSNEIAFWRVAHTMVSMGIHVLELRATLEGAPFIRGAFSANEWGKTLRKPTALKQADAPRQGF